MIDQQEWERQKREEWRHKLMTMSLPVEMPVELVETVRRAGGNPEKIPTTQWGIYLHGDPTLVKMRNASDGEVEYFHAPCRSAKTLNFEPWAVNYIAVWFE